MAKRTTEVNDSIAPPRLPDWRSDPALLEAETVERGLVNRKSWIIQETNRVGAQIREQERQLEAFAEQQVAALASGEAVALASKPDFPESVQSLRGCLADLEFEGRIHDEAIPLAHIKTARLRQESFRRALASVINWPMEFRAKAVKWIFELRESLFGEVDFLKTLREEANEAGVDFDDPDPLAPFRVELYKMLAVLLIRATKGGNSLMKDAFISGTIMASRLGRDVVEYVRQDLAEGAASRH